MRRPSPHYPGAGDLGRGTEGSPWSFSGIGGRRPYCCLGRGPPAVISRALTGLWACRPRGAKMWEALVPTGSARAGGVERNTRVREFSGLPAAPFAQVDFPRADRCQHVHFIANPCVADVKSRSCEIQR